MSIYSLFYQVLQARLQHRCLFNPLLIGIVESLLNVLTFSILCLLVGLVVFVLSGLLLFLVKLLNLNAYVLAFLVKSSN